MNRSSNSILLSTLFACCMHFAIAPQVTANEVLLPSTDNALVRQKSAAAQLLTSSKQAQSKIIAQNQAGQSAGKSQSWDPAHTWAFLVCVMSWPKKAGLDAFDTENRKDLKLRDELLKQGVPSDHIVFISDKNAMLKTINEQLSSLLARTQPGDFLLTYYCGHGWTSDGEAFFGNYDADDNDNHCWRVSSFVQKLAKEFHGSTALLTADCCHSGALGEEMNRKKTDFNYATLSSSTSAISSTGNWTFTAGLLDSLQGHRYADYDNNGTITYIELAKYLQSEMQTIEKQNTATSRSAGFDPNFSISKVRFPNETIPELVEVLWEKEWYPAKVVEKVQGRSRIRWIEIGWDAPASDEWVVNKNIRPMRPEALKLPKATAQKWQVGTRLKVEFEGQYYPAQIIKYRNGSYLVHYDDYESTDDEWVDEERMRL